MTLRRLLARAATATTAAAALLLTVLPADAAAYGAHDPVPGAVRLYVPYDGTPHVIAFAGSANRAKAQLWTLGGSGNQNVRAVRVGTTADGEPVVYFQDAGSGKCLDESRDRPAADGTVVYLYTCSRAANQLWELREGSLGWGYSVVNRYDGRCLDAKGKSWANGTQLQVWSCSGAWNQIWLTNVY